MIAGAGPGRAAEPPGAAAPPPRVVVSVMPVHSLVAAVMAEAGRPHLLVRGGASPHTYALRPSDARALGDADVVFRIGAGLDGFLDRPLRALAGRARIVGLAREAGLEPIRTPAGDDPHVWLDPVNAARIAAHAASVLGALDAPRAGVYAANLARLRARLAALDGELAAALAPVRRIPYVVFHDAYRYFERRYRLNRVAAVTLGPERRPGARRLAGIRARIVAAGAACVFAEPQFEPPLVAALIRGTAARAGVLDPLGAGLAPGPDAYPALMRGLAASLRSCLAGG